MEEPAYREYVIRILKNTLLVMLPVSLLFGAFGTPVIRVLFEGGDFKTNNPPPPWGGGCCWRSWGGVVFDPGLAEQGLFCHGEALAPLSGWPRRSWGSAWSPTRGSPILCRRGRSCWPLGRRWAFCWWGGVAYFQFARKGGFYPPRKPLLRCCGFSLGIGGLGLGRVPPASGIHGFQRVDGCGLQRRRRGVPVAVCAPHGALAAHT